MQITSTDPTEVNISTQNFLILASNSGKTYYSEEKEINGIKTSTSSQFYECLFYFWLFYDYTWNELAREMNKRYAHFEVQLYGNSASKEEKIRESLGIPDSNLFSWINGSISQKGKSKDDINFSSHDISFVSDLMQELIMKLEIEQFDFNTSFRPLDEDLDELFYSSFDILVRAVKPKSHQISDFLNSFLSQIYSIVKHNDIVHQFPDAIDFIRLKIQISKP